MEELATLYVYGFFTILGVVAGLLLGAGLGIITLRMAGKWLGFEEIGVWTAFKSALIANFTTAVTNFSIGFNYGLTMQLVQQWSGREPRHDEFARFMGFQMNPIYYIYLIAFGLLITAVIFGRTLRKPGSEIPLFRDCFALSAVYFALTFTVVVVLTFLVYTMITLIYAVA